ncbi:MAG: ribokinase [Planctomycetes bacterium]|nr:ribokinase [Planctomycetota bacterium]
MVRIAVVGSANTDLVARVDRLPGSGETLLASSYAEAGGGKGANQAVAARRMGADVVFIGAVGLDDYAARTRRFMEAEGIDTSFLYAKDTHSGVALILVEENTGENMIAVAPGANFLLLPADIRAARAAIESADILLLQMEILPETLAEALALAHGAGVSVILNPAPAPPPGLLDTLLRSVTYLTPNVHELALITGGRPVDDAVAHLLASGPDALFVTLGPDGAALYTRAGAAETVPSFDVVPVDTVGAGDAFNGALAVLVAEGLPLVEAMRGAVAAGAIAVTRNGAQPSQPRRSEVDALLAGGSSR